MSVKEFCGSPHGAKINYNTSNTLFFLIQTPANVLYSSPGNAMDALLSRTNAVSAENANFLRIEVKCPHSEINTMTKLNSPKTPQ